MGCCGARGRSTSSSTARAPIRGSPTSRTATSTRARRNSSKATAVVTSKKVGCTSSVPKLVPLGIPVAESPNVPLEVVTRSTAVRDPLPVTNTNVVYGDIEAAMGHAVSTATVDWALGHAAVMGRFDEGDLASIIAHQATAAAGETRRASEDHTLQPGSSAWEGFGQ